MRGRAASRFVGPIAAAWLAAWSAACTTTPQTTVLRGADLEAAQQAMAHGLAASPFLRDRDASAPPIVIVTQKVENLTSDVIPPREQWMIVARLQGSLPVIELGRQKNIRFIVPPEHHDMLREAGYDGELGRGLAPTHVMTATFRSSTRTVRPEDGGPVQRRQEYYTFEYRITELETRQLVWTDSFEFKREAVGVQID